MSNINTNEETLLGNKLADDEIDFRKIYRKLKKERNLFFSLQSVFLQFFLLIQF